MNVSLVPSVGGNQLRRLKFNVHVEEMLGGQPVEERQLVCWCAAARSRRSSLCHRPQRGLQLDRVDEGVLAGHEPVGRHHHDVEAVESDVAGYQRPVQNPVVVAVEDAVRLERELGEPVEQLGEGVADGVAADDGFGAEMGPELGVIGVQRDDRVRIAVCPRGEIALRDRPQVDDLWWRWGTWEASDPGYNIL